MAAGAVTTMVLRGEALIGAYTFTYSVHGQRGQWEVSITAPGNITKSDETTERTWFPLFSEMLGEAYHAAQKKRFPERLRTEPMPT
jgi:hypothetical protein